MGNSNRDERRGIGEEKLAPVVIKPEPAEATIPVKDIPQGSYGLRPQKDPVEQTDTAELQHLKQCMAKLLQIESVWVAARTSRLPYTSDTDASPLRSVIEKPTEEF